MGVSIAIIAISKPGKTWLQHKAVWDACEAAGVTIPAATRKYFDYEGPNPEGLITGLGYIDAPEAPYTTQTEDGINIDVSALPENTLSIKLEYC